MIKVENVSLVIKKTTILDDINAEFADGKIHGLIGRNDSGKTVLMKCICGFMKPTGASSANGTPQWRPTSLWSAAVSTSSTSIRLKPNLKRLPTH